MKKNVAGQKVGAQMVSATDGSAFTGSVTVEVTLDAGTQATGTVGSGACTHEGNGYHTYAPSQAETNGDLVAFTFHGTGAVPATVQVYTSFPQTGDAFAGCTVSAIGAGVITAASIADGAIDWATFATDVLPKLGVVSYGVLDAGGASSFTLPAGQRTNVSIGDAFYVPGKGCRLILTYNNSTGAGTTASAGESNYAASDAYVVFKLPKSEPFGSGDFPTGGVIDVNVQKIHNVTLTGSGTAGDPMDHA